MPNVLPKEVVDDARAAALFAEQVRRYHRRRTAKGSKQRETDIDLALKRVREAMKAVRRETGRFQYGPQNAVAERNRETIREVSAACQSERRKLWKMRRK